MNTATRRARILFLSGVLAAAACGQRSQAGSAPPSAPALWEPADQNFKGCAGS